MNRLFNLMFKMPFQLFTEAAAIFSKTAEGIQRAVGEAADELTSHTMPSFEDPRPWPDASSDGPPTTTSAHTYQLIEPAFVTTERPVDNKEHLMHDYDDYTHGNGKDLTGDDLKFVSYSIIFTKRDFEATLQPEREELVDYDTDGGAFGALKLTEFFDELRDGRNVPREWRDGSRGRPGPDRDYGFANGRYTRIPKEDRKYIRFVYHVNKRMKKSEVEYDRDQRDAQKQIATNIGRIADSI